MKTKNNNIIIAFISFLLGLPPILAGFSQTKEPLKEGIKAIIYSPEINMTYISLIIVIISFLIFIFKSQKITIYKSFIGLPLLIFILWAFLSLIWAQNKYLSIQILFRTFVGFLAFLLVLNFFKKENIKTLLLLLFLSGFTISLIGILQNIFGFDWLIQANPPGSTFSNRNLAVGYILLTMPLGILFFLETNSKLNAWFYAILISLMLTYIFFTLTRAGYLALLCQVFVLTMFFLYDRYKLKNKLIIENEKKWIIAFALALTFLLSNMSQGGFGKTFIKFIDKITIQREQRQDELIPFSGGKIEKDKRLFTGSRWSMYVNTFAIIKDHPIIGVGANNWAVYYPLYQNVMPTINVIPEPVEMTKTHNDFLEILAELGIIGFLLLLWIIFRILKVFQKIALNKDNPDRFIVLFIVIGLIGISIDASFNFPLSQPAPLFIVLIYCAILDILFLFHSYKDINPDNHSITIAPKLGKTIIISFLSIILIITIFAYNHFYKAENSFFKAQAGWHNHLPDVMLNEGIKAYQLNPYRKELLFFIGSGYLKANKPDLALPYLQETIKYYPNRAPALRELGFVYTILGDYENATKTFEHFLLIEPKESVIHNYLAKIYLTQKNGLKALEHFQLSVFYAPTNTTFLKDIGTALYYSFQQKEEGAKYFKRILELDPENKDKAELLKLIQLSIR